MDTVCSFFAVTWYPGGYPSTSDPLVLLAVGTSIDAASPILADLEQLVQEAEYVRGATPDFFPRGGRRLRLQWVERVKFSSPAEALAENLARQESMPERTGWALLEIPAVARAWAIEPVAFRSHVANYNLAAKSHRRQWELLAGSSTEIALTSPEHAWLWDNGAPVLWDDDTYMALETLP